MISLDVLEKQTCFQMIQMKFVFYQQMDSDQQWHFFHINRNIRLFILHSNKLWNHIVDVFSGG